MPVGWKESSSARADFALDALAKAIVDAGPCGLGTGGEEPFNAVMHRRQLQTQPTQDP